MKRDAVDTHTASPGHIRAAAVRAWENVLGRTGFDGDADFFELGGDSVGGARLMASLRGEFGETLPLTLIFFHPAFDEFTAALAEAVSELPAAAEQEAGAAHRPARTQAVPEPRAALPASGRLRLSPEQESQWVAEQVTPGNLAYTELLALRLTGPLDPERLQSTLDRLVERHAALRTRFPVDPEGRPVQEILTPDAAPRLTLERRDAEDEAAVRALALDRLAEPFDLAAGPLLRAQLVRLSTTDHVFLLYGHHIVADGPSMEVLCEELGGLYTGREPAEPAPSYAEHTHRQHSLDLGAQLGYWREQLDGATDIELPLDRPRPAVRDIDGRRYRFTVPGSVVDRLDALAREERATRFTVLLAAFQTLLGRWAGTQDVVVGCPVTARSQPGLEKMTGALLNMVCFRGDLGGDPTFRELLVRTRQAGFGAMAHSDVPFSRVLAELAQERDASRPALFSSTLNLQPTPPDLRADLGEVSAEPFPVPRHYAMYDFSLYAWQAPHELLIDIEYATALFDEATVVAFADRFGALLRSAAAEPDRPLSELDTVGEAELRLVLKDWNDTGADLGPDRCVHELFEEQARATPERTAVIGPDRHLSYAELDAEATELAAGLGELGVGPESVVAVCLERSTRLLVTLLAVAKAGGAFLPLGPDWPAQRRDFVLADAGAEFLVDASGMHRCGAAAKPAARAGLRPSPGNLAYVLYTSGSTGTPKGVMVTHRALVNRLRWMRRDCGLGAGDVVLQNAVPTFDYAMWELFGPLHMGATAVLPSADGHRDFSELTRLITEHGVTVAHFVPSLLRLFADEPEAARCTGLRVLFSGGEPLDPALAARVQQVLPGVRMFNAYGPTEAAVDVTCWPVPELPASVAIGGPAANTTAYVLDERMRPQPVGVPGELYLGGVQLARGYRGQPGLTAERFLPDPFGTLPGGRLYRTGDRARWRSDGVLEYVDRIDRQIKLRGVRVEPGEAEAALLAHPAVREAAVVAAEGNGGLRLVAYYCGRPPGGEQELRDHLADRLPEFALPTMYMELPDGLPVLASGKLDRAALPAPAAVPQRAARTTAPGGDSGYEAPLGPRELMLAALWSEVLGVDRIGREDSFFQLGGDSILGIQMVAKARRVGMQLTVPALFRHSTLAALAAAAGESGDGAKVAAAAPGSASAASPTRFPLTPLQREMLREAAAAPGRGVYVVPAELLLDGEVDPESMRTAFRRLVERHPVLRTSVRWHERPEQSEQQVHPATEPSFRYEDWSGYPADEQARRRRDLLEEEWRSGFPAEAAQLSRMILLRLGARRFAMVWTRHNVLLDGWSFSQLYDELLDMHAALRDNRPEPVADPRAPFSDYVEWLLPRQRAAAERLWNEQLKELSPKTLFVPEVGPSAERYRELRFPLPARAEAFAKDHGVTVSTVLEAAWAAVLARRTGATDVQFGSVFSARDADVLDIERMLGLMINTLPSGLRLNREETVADWIRTLHHRGALLKELFTADLGLLQERSGTGGALWDTLLLIHNYPHSFHDAPTGGLRVVGTAGFSRVGAALIVSVDVKPLRLAMMYDEARADEALVRDLAAELAEVLHQLADRPDGTVGDLLG
ncbi:amino acid adenylation domain-containing protein [Streptomyces sp. NPDC059828]|uniref:amino acid adenylation domain-containing protein n=1 Tax=Streptomyces sp. NPDC059828 TaxID=3346965 RepID=UPI00365B2D3B